MGGRFETSPALRTPDKVWSAKPDADTVRRNGPDETFAKENWPCSRERTSVAGERPSCDSVTLAPAMAAPVSSIIVPLMIPDGWASGFEVCGKAGEAQRRSATAGQTVYDEVMKTAVRIANKQ